uniref:Flagellum-specific ATP synthase n=1 Tax=Zymomonas mobilis TaxID=542 RepID=Q9F5L8_ZYMMB|nr:probable H+-transporting ATP synthase [Zymomonas mobilis subsp. mobilis ZM4 = ATCC 31821]
MSESLAAYAGRILGHVSIDEGTPRWIGKLVAYDGLMLEATGFPMPIGHGALIMDANGQSSRAEVVGVPGNTTVLMALDADAPHNPGARVEPDRQLSIVHVGDGLLGRVIGALGEPLDNLGPIITDEYWPLVGKMGNPLNRGRVTSPFDMGVRAINALLTAGVGQRIAIMAGSGVGKSVLMGQMIAGAKADVIVTGLIGERSREVTDFVETKISDDVRPKSVVVAGSADHPPVLRLRAAMRATAIAEYFRAKGKNVLLLNDSLTRIAHAQREVGLSLGEPPTIKGYPPSALGLIPRLVERAGIDIHSKGAITAIYTVLADGDDPDDPIVDTARAIVDGHIILSRSLAEQGVFPAIDLGKSLSRVMSDIISPGHRQAAAHLRRLWSVYEENRDLILMGAYRSGTDASIDEAINRHNDVLDFIRQGQNERFDLATSIATLMERFAV